MQLRPYQQEAREAVQAEWAKGRKRTLLVLPTGCGKTIVFSKIIEDQVKKGKRVLVLAHRSELLEQASDKLKTATGLGTALEKASLALFRPCRERNDYNSFRPTGSIRLWLTKLITLFQTVINVCLVILRNQMC